MCIDVWIFIPRYPLPSSRQNHRLTDLQVGGISDRHKPNRRKPWSINVLHPFTAFGTVFRSTHSQCPAIPLMWVICPTGKMQLGENQLKSRFQVYLGRLTPFSVVPTLFVPPNCRLAGWRYIRWSKCNSALGCHSHKRLRQVEENNWKCRLGSHVAFKTTTFLVCLFSTFC